MEHLSYKTCEGRKPYIQKTNNRPTLKAIRKTQITFILVQLKLFFISNKLNKPVILQQTTFFSIICFEYIVLLL